MLTGVRVDNLVVADSRPIEWPLLDADGAPLDVRGWSALAEVRAYPGGPVLHRWSSTDRSIVLTVGALTLQVTDVEGWTWRVGDYDIVLRAPGQTEPTIVARGRIRVTTRISHG